MSLDLSRLPENFTRQLRAFRRRLLYVEIAVTVCGAFCGFWASYFLLYISDRFWDTPAVLRWFFTGGGVLVMALFARFLGRNWVYRRRDILQLTRLVQKHYPGFGDSLLGMVDLACRRDRPANISEALCRAAVEQVTERAAGEDFRQAVSLQRAVRLTLGLGSGLLLFAGLIALDYRAAANAWARWVYPGGSVPRYTFTQFRDMPDERVVAHGEHFAAAFGLRPDSQWLPPRARYAVGTEPWETVTLNNLGGEITVPGMTREDRLYFRAGDGRASILIRPLHRPVLISLRAAVRLPEYLHYPVKEIEAAGRSLSMPAGSTVTFTGRVNRELTEARLTAGEETVLKVDGPVFSGTITPPDDVTQGCISWTDTAGLTVRSPHVFRINYETDDPPGVKCEDLHRTTYMLEHESLAIRAAAWDDYGVKIIEAEYEVLDAHGVPREGARQRAVVAEGGYDVLDLTGVFMLSPRVMNIPAGSDIRFQVTARDYRPENAPARARYRIIVLTPEQHARLLEQQFEAVMGSLEELTRREEELLEKKNRLEARADPELMSREGTDRLAYQEREEMQNAARVDEMVRRGVEAIKEALRNEHFSTRNLREWQEMLRELDEMSQQETRQMREALRKARHDPGMRRQELEEAIRQQKRMLQRLRKLQKKMDEAMKRETARTFIHRLREAAAVENKLAVRMEKELPVLIGLVPEEMPADNALVIRGMADDQAENAARTGRIRADLYSFFVRIRDEKYLTVFEAMKDMKIEAELKKLSGDIGRNLLVESIIKARAWAAQLMAWADQLQGEQEEPRREGESADMTPEQVEILLALMRIIQGEHELREATRTLEQQKERVDDYRKQGEGLGDTQHGLQEELKKTAQKLPDPRIQGLFEKVYRAMADAENLLRKPQTDGAVIAAETEVIELLMASSQQASRGMGAGAAAIMQMLMQQMTGAGSTGGGSLQGGLSDDPNAAFSGGTDGQGEERTGPGRAAGEARPVVPPEFRDALEAYFQAVNTVLENRPEEK